MSERNEKYVSKMDFFGMMVGVYCFIFVVHMTSEIQYRFFHDYVTILIIVVQLICIYSLLRQLQKGKQFD